MQKLRRFGDSWTQTFDNRLVWDWLFAQRKRD